VSKKRGDSILSFSIKKADLVLFLSIGALCIFYAARDILLLPVPEFVFTGLSLFAFVYLRPGYALSFYIFTSQLVLPGNPIRLLYFLTSWFYQNRRKKARISIPMIGMMLLSFLTMGLYSNTSVGNMVYSYIEKMLYIIIPMLWLSDVYTVEDVQRAAKCYVVSAIFAFSILLIMTLNGLGIEGLLRSGFRLGFSTGIVNSSTMISSYNSNAIASTSVLGVSFLCALLERKAVSSKYVVSLSIPLVLFAFLTKSRTGLLMEGILLLVYMGYLAISKKRLKQCLSLLAVVLLFAVIICKYFPTVLEAFLNRFQAEDITNGRTAINGEYIQRMLSDPMLLLFGYGIGNYVRIANITILNSAHNAFVDILMCWGILGVGLVIAFWVELYRSIKERNGCELSIIAYMPFFLYFFAIQGGQYLTTGLPHIRLCFSILFLRACVPTMENAEDWKSGELCRRHSFE